MTRLTRDIYVPAGDVEERGDIGVSVMYGDLEGGQRTITRFALIPRDDGTWMLSAGRVWNVDRANPR